MFRSDSMFVSKSNHQNKGVVYQSGQLLPVLSAGNLLGGHQYKFFLDQCRTLSELSEELFQSLYFKLILNFASYVQLLPRDWSATLGSLLHSGLSRAMRCLFHFVEAYPDSPAVDRYAMFSAALLQEISSLFIYQKVFITDEQGNTKFEWNPFTGPMTPAHEGDFYRLISLGNHFQRMDRAVTLLLARQVMPEEGFLWISAFPELLAEWLSALEGDDGGRGRLLKILQLYEFPVENSPNINLSIDDIPDHDSVATKYGDLFLEWIKSAIETGELTVNAKDSSVFVTQDGVFLDKGVFKKFTELYDVPVNMFVVFEQFGNLFGLTKLSGLDHRIDQLFSDEQARGVKQNFLGEQIKQKVKSREGVLVTEAALIFKGVIPEASSFVRSFSNTKNYVRRSVPSAPSLSS